MSPKPDVSEERTEQIMNAAEQVFKRKGLNQARMDDIAEETGLSKGTLYLYFKSKQELIISILERFFQATIAKFYARVDTDLSAVDAISQFTEAAIHDYSTMLHVLPITYEFFAMAFRNKIVQKAMTNYFDHFLETLTPIIQRGIDAGELRPVDADEVAIAIGAIYEGTVLLWIYDKTKVDIEQHIRSSIQLLLDGIQVKA